MKVKTNIPDNALLFPESHLTSRAAEAEAYMMALVAAFSWFDLEAISELLPEDVQYADSTNKWGFLSEMQSIFDDIKSENHPLTFPLQAKQSVCNGCSVMETDEENKGKTIFAFFEVIGKKRKNVFGLLFKSDEVGNIICLCRCVYAGKKLPSRPF
jgi:hypothetical protein